MKKHLVTSFVASAFMFVGVAAAQATPISYLGTLAPLVQVAGVNSQPSSSQSNPEGADYWRFFATAGDNVDLFGDRQVGHFDMSFWVLFGTFADTSAFGGSFDIGDSSFVVFGDDQDAPNIAGPFGDPHVNFFAPTTGFYTVAVTNFLSSVSTDNNPYTLQGRGIQAVPEPASMLLLGTGLAGLVIARRRARKA